MKKLTTLICMLCVLTNQTCKTTDCCNPVLFTEREQYENADRLIRNATQWREPILLISGLATLGGFTGKMLSIEGEDSQIPSGAIIGGCVGMMIAAVRHYLNQQKCVARIKRMLNSGKISALYEFYPESVVAKLRQLDHGHEVAEYEVRNLMDSLKSDVDGYFIENPDGLNGRVWTFLKSGRLNKRWKNRKKCHCRSCSRRNTPAESHGNFSTPCKRTDTHISTAYGGTERR